MLWKRKNYIDFEQNNFRRFDMSDFIVNVEEKIEKYIVRHYDPHHEKGGYLFGYKIQDAKEISINTLTIPNKKDGSKEGEFILSSSHKRNAKKMIKNGGTLIGFWHTHPKNIQALPSSVDMVLFNEIYLKTSLPINVHIIFNGDVMNVIKFKQDKYEAKKW